MHQFRLKDGRDGEIHIWGFDEFTEVIHRKFSRKKIHQNKLYEGFRFLGPHNVVDLKRYNSSSYSDEEQLSPLEIQPERKLPNEQYHKIIAATIDSKLTGIIICQWIKDSLPFWRYHFKFIDVNEDFKNKGIGSILVHTLNESDFLNNKIFQNGLFSSEGLRYISQVMEREMKGENYAFIPSNYCLLSPPKERGVFDNIGRLRV